MKSKFLLVGMFVGLGVHLTQSDMPIYKHHRPKLSGPLARDLKNKLLFETEQKRIICDEVFGLVRRCGILYLDNNEHYYNDPAYLNLHDALFTIQSNTWDKWKSSDVIVYVDFLQTPGYYLYNDFGLRIKQPSTVGHSATIKGLIHDYIEHSFE